MTLQTLIKPGEYHDSVTLMQVAKDLLAMPGIKDAAVWMGTEANKGILDTAGLLTPEAKAASPNDLIVCVEAANAKQATAALARVDELLAQTRISRAADEAYHPHTLASALGAMPDANLVVISVAGQYAVHEAQQALERDLHVLLFSDNVPLADEIALKKMARQRGLLLMGPDAGTAIINGVALGFANVVPRGDIGLVAASGTGLQEVTSLIAREGGGVSQAVGVGGRDLMAEVGGVMMLAGLEALQADPETDVMVLISKPPDRSVVKQVLAQVRDTPKPTVVCFLGSDAEAIRKAGALPAATLEEAALLALALGQGRDPASVADRLAARDEDLASQAAEAQGALRLSQRYVRGLFSGGTFCYEAMLVLQDLVGTVQSNVSPIEAFRLADANRSLGHTCVDLGEDEFTQGRLHPMLDPDLRNRRIVQEAHDPETAVILLDVVLGYGVHPDPAGAAVEAIEEAQAVAAAEGRQIVVMASLCGTRGDPQNLADQEAKLRKAGVFVAESNAAAARLAGLILKGGG
jgi:FdrA protein